MSGELFTETAVETALWPLRIWSDNGIGVIECGECDAGQIIAVGRYDRPILLAELLAKVEEHIPNCTRVRR